MNPQNLNGKLALITGASRGLGREIALALAAEGAQIVVTGRDKAKLDETCALITAAGGRIAGFQADVTSEAEVATLETEISKQLGTVSILVNNAGINVRKPLTQFTLDEWNKVLNTNLTGAFLMCRAFVPHMKGSGYGRILNLTSIMSHVALPERTAYCASKAGLLGMTRALALEVAGQGITVNGISPGPFATEMNQTILDDPEKNSYFISRIPQGHWGKVQDIGKLAVFLCSEGASFITGTDILIDGGWTAQ